MDQIFTRDCVAHMASVYEDITHPALPRSWNSLLIVPLVARTREESAFATNTPVKSHCQPLAMDLAPICSILGDIVAQKKKIAKSD